jgi:N4-(beta-N-acetylglucosaminyl)-L-asparaginase
MTTRRNFIKSSALASAALLVSRSNAATLANEDLSIGGTVKPIVLSTWNFGLKANEGAWAILSKNGKALDAVEAGVKITEADPSV